MEPNKNNPMLTTLAKGVIVGSLVLTSLVLTGCDQILDSQSAALAAELATKLDEPLATVARVAMNHNETFLAGAKA